MRLHSKAGQETAHLIQSLRSDGPLSELGLKQAHRAHAALSFDPIQGGWVYTDTKDDIGLHHVRPGWSKAERGGEVSFRPWALSDAVVFRALLNNPNVWTFLPSGYPGDITLDVAKDLIALADDGALHKVRAICLDDLPVGQVRLEFREDEPELSYWLGQPYWGKGIGGKAVSRFVADCFAADPDLDRMMARVKLGNPGSLKLLEKAGFARDLDEKPIDDWIILRRNRNA